MGREFVEIFDEWADSYDESVGGHDPEYADVFKHYDGILESVAMRAESPVVEFGTGTGNLLKKLLERNLEAVGVEPNDAMRKAASAKFPEARIVDGDFLSYEPGVDPRTFVSTYAFHHLTDEEKARAVKRYAEELPAGGKVVFADTVFATEQAKRERIRYEEDRGFTNVAEDLKREYYTTVPVMRELFEQAGFTVVFTQLNDFVWLIDASKQEGGDAR
ncbi:class I SAM-dependent methyltransferase [Indiicoccus explosivorum]|uniref:class I SAM-dependent methyltransferase n=1 Tax=Indiicoccus explosivorum TaxID=1917864 RepID=UPI000B4551D9|nr:class I SAM-dependent methyltransferase [Indiicoccus explosivorum]